MTMTGFTSIIGRTSTRKILEEKDEWTKLPSVTLSRKRWMCYM